MEFDYDPKRAQEELIYLKEIVEHLQRFIGFVKELGALLPKFGDQEFLGDNNVDFASNFQCVRRLVSRYNNLKVTFKLEELLRKKLWGRRNKFLDKVRNREVMLKSILRFKKIFKFMILLSTCNEVAVKKIAEGRHYYLGLDGDSKKFFKLFRKMMSHKYEKGHNGWHCGKGDIAPVYGSLVENYTYFKAVIKERELDQKVWEEVVKICRNKILDFKNDIFIYHSTPANWSKYEIENFIKVGILSPANAGKIDASHGKIIPHNISLSMFVPGWGFNQWGEISFIINPEYVKARKSSFLYAPYADPHTPRSKRMDSSSNHVAVAADKLGIPVRWRSNQYGAPFGLGLDELGQEYERGAYELDLDEIIGPGNIPFREIVGIVLYPKHFGKIRYLMTKLVSIDPKLVFPIYDVNGNVLWPSLK
jgi:hypothetical protein